MREKLNSNPLLQVAVIGILLLGSGFFVMSTMGGSEKEPASEAPAAELEVGSASEAPPVAELGSATSSAAGAPPATTPPPPAVTKAFDANQTVVLLFTRDSGIDDRLVARSVRHLEAFSGVTTFVVPASQIARYASITQGVAVDRVPALVVIRPKHLDEGIPVASVSYGFQSPESVVQSVVDAGYTGPTVDYHP